jgi:hypothetical protein
MRAKVAFSGEVTEVKPCHYYLLLPAAKQGVEQRAVMLGVRNRGKACFLRL